MEKMKGDRKKGKEKKESEDKSKGGRERGKEGGKGGRKERRWGGEMERERAGERGKPYFPLLVANPSKARNPGHCSLIRESGGCVGLSCLSVLFSTFREMDG